MVDPVSRTFDYLGLFHETVSRERGSVDRRALPKLA